MEVNDHCTKVSCYFGKTSAFTDVTGTLFRQMVKLFSQGFRPNMSILIAVFKVLCIQIIYNDIEII